MVINSLTIKASDQNVNIVLQGHQVVKSGQY